MGDVALTTPVISSVLCSDPGVEITLVTRFSFAPLFGSLKGLRLFHPDFKGRHKGIAGIFQLYKDLKKQSEFDYIIDIHDVLRSKIIRSLFRLSGVPVAVIDKGRADKRGVITGKRKVQIRHTVERYCKVFESAGFPVNLNKDYTIKPSMESLQKISGLIEKQDVKNIGIAPYARHELKRWPEENMIRLTEMIGSRFKSRFWLFGGPEDLEKMEKFQLRVPESVNLIGKLTLGEEMALMSRLDLMIAMDSSNMHMAALAGAKVISIWGGTDPLTGFSAWRQPDEFAVRIPVEDLTCRPCTVYGKGKCLRGDFACMIWLTPEKVFEKLISLKIL